MQTLIVRDAPSGIRPVVAVNLQLRVVALQAALQRKDVRASITNGQVHRPRIPRLGRHTGLTHLTCHVGTEDRHVNRAGIPFPLSGTGPFLVRDGMRRRLIQLLEDRGDTDHVGVVLGV